jgi:hypothetical protein
MSSFDAWALPPGFTQQEEDEPRRGPSEASFFRWLALSPGRLRELMAFLREARERELAALPVGRVVQSVGKVAERLLDHGDPLRDRVLDGVAELAGYSREMAGSVLEGMARGWTQEALWGLIRSEFPQPSVLDRFCPDRAGRNLRAMGFLRVLADGDLLDLGSPGSEEPGALGSDLTDSGRLLVVVDRLVIQPSIRDLSLIHI